MRMSRIAMLALVLFGLVSVEQAKAQTSQAPVAQRGQVTILDVSVPATGPRVDFVNAQPKALPRAPSRTDADSRAAMVMGILAPSSLASSWFVPGGNGNGTMAPVHLGAPSPLAAEDDEVTSEEFGTGNRPFSTARADLNPLATNTSFPYRASGKLFFTRGASTFTCSASLIKRGVVVTAAHCVADFGGELHTGFSFVPGYRSGSAPYGVWAAKRVFVLTSYLNGTDSCTVDGVVCQNDIAVLFLKPQAGAYPGTSTGWYGYAGDGYGFTAGGLTQITQTGYPGCLNNGKVMQRNDSAGFKDSTSSDNTVIGSLMCGGSSGGPWLVNFGLRPKLTGAGAGMVPDPNIVVGVTSWGYVNGLPKEQGASPFLSTNIPLLVESACALAPAACS